MEKRIEKLESVGVGLKPGTLELKDHNPRWKRAFADEAYAIYDALRLESLRLYHIGSTSIPGIASKPVIDILGSVESLNELDAACTRLESLGYVWRGEYGIPGRRYATLSNPVSGTRYVHVHFFEHTHPAIDEHLLFRNHLRTHSGAAREYELAKRKLIDEGVERERYPDLKGAFVTKLLEEARLARTPPSKVLCVLGCALGGRHTHDFLQELGRGYESFSLIDLNATRVGPFVYGERAPKPEDAFFSVVEKMLQADLIQLATPVYWYAMAGAMKDFMDRFSDLMAGSGKPLGEALYGKRLELIVTGYDEDLPLGFEVPFSATAIYFGMDYVGATYRSVRD
jgi:GrpB-like predicted nucleotidyltransferase (UPF0157 family)